MYGICVYSCLVLNIGYYMTCYARYSSHSSGYVMQADVELFLLTSIINTTDHYMLNIRGYNVTFLPYFGCFDRVQIFRNYSLVLHFFDLMYSKFFSINIAFEIWQISELLINLFTNIILKNKKDTWNSHNFLINNSGDWYSSYPPVPLTFCKLRFVLYSNLVWLLRSPDTLLLIPLILIKMIQIIYFTVLSKGRVSFLEHLSPILVPATRTGGRCLGLVDRRLGQGLIPGIAILRFRFPFSLSKCNINTCCSIMLRTSI